MIRLPLNTLDERIGAKAVLLLRSGTASRVANRDSEFMARSGSKSLLFLTSQHIWKKHAEAAGSVGTGFVHFKQPVCACEFENHRSMVRQRRKLQVAISLHHLGHA